MFTMIAVLPDTVAFTAEGKLVRKATGCEQEKAGVTLSHIFLRRGKKDYPLSLRPAAAVE